MEGCPARGGVVSNAHLIVEITIKAENTPGMGQNAGQNPVDSTWYHPED
jgi:hypothetical protein